MSIHFFAHEVALPFSSSPLHEHFFKFIITSENATLGNLIFVFCSDEYLYSLNVQFLNHSYFTDVITFDHSSEHRLVNGEIYISIQRVQDNASFFFVSFQHELARVMIHGVLHLLGYKDSTNEEVQLMRFKENKYLSIYPF